MTDHSILCPAFVGALDRLAGTGASGPCECGVEAPAPLPVREDVVPEPEQAVAQPNDSEEFKCRSCGEKHPASFASTNDVSVCRWCSGEEGDDEPKVIETACADSRPPVEPVVGAQAELPFDPEPLVEPEPDVKKATAPIGFIATNGQGKPDPNGGYLAPVASAPDASKGRVEIPCKTCGQPSRGAVAGEPRCDEHSEGAWTKESRLAPPPCVACGGTGQSSKGGQCSPCSGSGKKWPGAEAPQTASITVAQPTTPAPPAQDAPTPAAEKPKRKRRTKAEIEADKSKAAATNPPTPSSATIPPAPDTPATIRFTVPPECAPKGDVQVVAGTVEVKPGGVVVTMSPENRAPLKVDLPRPVVQVVSTEEETKLRIAIASHEAVIKKLIQERDALKAESDAKQRRLDDLAFAGLGVAPTATKPPGPKKRIFVGIDPGLTGFQSAVDEDMKIVFMTACPTIEGNTRRIHDAQGIVDEVRRWKGLGVDTVLMEAQQAFPKIGSIANFVKGVSKGVWEAALLAHGIRFDTLRPIDWKKAMGIAGGAPKDVKRRAIAKAQRLFPGIDLRENPDSLRAKKLSSDKAESLLLAVYVARMALGAAPGTDQWEKLESADAAMVKSAPALNKKAADVTKKEPKSTGEDVDVVDEPPSDEADSSEDEEKAAALKELGERIKRGVNQGLKNLAKITKLPVRAEVPTPKKPAGKPKPSNERDMLRAAIRRATAKGKK